MSSVSLSKTCFLLEELLCFLWLLGSELLQVHQLEPSLPLAAHSLLAPGLCSREQGRVSPARTAPVCFFICTVQFSCSDVFTSPKIDFLGELAAAPAWLKFLQAGQTLDLVLAVPRDDDYSSLPWLFILLFVSLRNPSTSLDPIFLFCWRPHNVTQTHTRSQAEPSAAQGGTSGGLEVPSDPFLSLFLSK